MTRFDFLYELRQGLKDLSEKDIMEHIVYYREMIEDRIEDGFSEEEALSEIGNPKEIAMQILLAETSLPKLVKAKLKKDHPVLSSREITLLIVGSPLWLVLLVCALSVVVSFLAIILSVVVSLYAATISLVACGVAGIIGTIPLFFTSNAYAAFAVLGIGLASVGLGVLMFFASNRITKFFIKLSKKFLMWIKSFFISKEVAEDEFEGDDEEN